MIHRGEIVEKAVRESAYSITKLADKLGKSRRHIYNMFENNRLDWDVIRQIGRIIHHDFSKDFEEFAHIPDNMVQEQETPYRKHDLNTCLEELNYWKSKYIELLERNNELLSQQIIQVQQQYKKKGQKDS